MYDSRLKRIAFNSGRNEGGLLYSPQICPALLVDFIDGDVGEEVGRDDEGKEVASAAESQ